MCSSVPSHEELDNLIGSLGSDVDDLSLDLRPKLVDLIQEAKNGRSSAYKDIAWMVNGNMTESLSAIIEALKFKLSEIERWFREYGEKNPEFKLDK